MGMTAFGSPEKIAFNANIQLCEEGCTSTDPENSLIQIKTTTQMAQPCVRKAAPTSDNSSRNIKTANTPHQGQISDQMINGGSWPKSGDAGMRVRTMSARYSTQTTREKARALGLLSVLCVGKPPDKYM